jgi:MoaA/NifB/PqqE/SkfB family radical SAM enzyme
MSTAEPNPPPPASTSFRGFLEDERCRFRPLKQAGLRVVIRLTYACDLACSHCLVDADGRTHELGTAEWLRLLAELPDIGAAKVLLTGGEPLLRHDLPKIVYRVSTLGIPVDLNSNLQRATSPILQDLRRSGLTELSTSLEGPPEVHDRMRGQAGAFAQTIRAIQWATDLGIEVDLACCLTRENLPHVGELLRIVKNLPVKSLTLARLLPVGHGRASRRGLAQNQLSRIYREVQQRVSREALLPVRMVGLLHPPEEPDCLRGESLIGIRPDGGLQGCVLAGENPVDVEHPLAVGLARSYRDLRHKLAVRGYRLCWQREEQPA